MGDILGEVLPWAKRKQVELVAGEFPMFLRNFLWIKSFLPQLPLDMMAIFVPTMLTNKRN